MTSRPNPAVAARLSNPDYSYIDNPNALPELEKIIQRMRLSTVVAIDTETTGLNPVEDHVRLVQVASDAECVIVDLASFRDTCVAWGEQGLRDLKELLEGPIPKVLQNAAFDLNFLRGSGIYLGGLIFDTMIASKIINNGTGWNNDLGSIVKRALHIELPKELQKANWGGEITHEMLGYAARDVICLLPLMRHYAQALKTARTRPDFTLMQLFQIEMNCLRAIAYMQWNGFGFDLEAAAKLRVELQKEADDMMQEFLVKLDNAIREHNPDRPEIWLPRDPDGSFNTRESTSGSIRLGTKRYAGFNPRSTKQMAERFNQAGIILPPNAKGGHSMDKNLLAFVRGTQPLVDAYMLWKLKVTRVSHVEKLLNSVCSDGRIHGTYRQVGTETGRLSAAEPNLQQIPREGSFRSLFRAAPGYKLVVADFSQVELRVAAQLSGEQRMRDAYIAGRDLHIETAALITGKPVDEITKYQRTSAKICNFGLLYGSGPATLRKQAVAQYGVDMSHKEAVKLVEGFRSAYPRLKAWQDEEGNRTTKAVLTKLGRRRMLVGFNDKYTTRINTQVQGTAGDIAKLAIAKLWSQLESTPANEAMLISMVHDEIVLEVRENAVDKWSTILVDCMQTAGAEICEDVPIIAEVSSGDTWAEAK